jgi:uncharacterized protein (TIGR03067 family)
MNALLLDAAALKETAALKEKESLRGTWEFVSGIREAQLFVAGDHFTMKFTNGDIYVGTFELDPTKEPRWIDMTVHEGPARHKGKTSLGVYELTGDYLIWCPGEPGTDVRPHGFPRRGDKSQLCVVFVRERPRRVTL